MPRKTKESNEIEEIKKTKKASVSTKKVTSAKDAKAKKSNTSTKKSTTEKEVKAKKSNTSTKKATKTSKITKEQSNSKTAKTKVATKRKSTISKPDIVEYYDLPLSYNQTVVKILYQTPKTLFVYWEISEDDANNYRKIYGENFFETTKPVLIIHNDTFNYSFEIEINDFANSWYFNVNDSNSIYRVELGRRPKQNNNALKEKYIFVSSSNTIESPNDHIIFEDYLPSTISFRNIKNNSRHLVSLKELLRTTSFANQLSKLYNIKISDLYKAIYQNETTSDLYKLINPSSNNSSF
jgi:hypothetical protein